MRCVKLMFDLKSVLFCFERGKLDFAQLLSPGSAPAHSCRQTSSFCRLAELSQFCAVTVLPPPLFCYFLKFEKPMDSFYPSRLNSNVLLP